MLVSHRLAELGPAGRREFIAALAPDQRAALIETVKWERQISADPLAHLTAVEWLRVIRPRAFDPQLGAAPFAQFHLDAINHFWGIGPEAPDPLLMLLFRGAAKSTITETGVVRLGAVGLRRYCLYMSATQDQADDHVSELAAVMESKALETYYPAMADRELGKYGAAKSWRRNRLRTSSGFVVDALGLDKAGARGAKIGDQRPDILVLDDIDSESDTAATVTKKERTIASKVIGSLAENVAIVFAQNLIHSGSIANRVLTRKSELLSNRQVIGPIPAINNIRIEARPEGGTRIVGGTPSWAGYGLDRAQKAVDAMGYGWFLTELQHEIAERPGALLSRADFDATRVAKPPADLDNVLVAVDPNHTGRSDDAGIVVMGTAPHPSTGDLHVYVLGDYSELSAPSAWRDVVIRAVERHRAGLIIVEEHKHGETAKLVLKGSPLWGDNVAVPIRNSPATTGKKDRARPVAEFYRDGRVHHVGTHQYLEDQWTSWDPDATVGSFSPGAVDACVHGIRHLLMRGTRGTRVRRL